MSKTSTLRMYKERFHKLCEFLGNVDKVEPDIPHTLTEQLYACANVQECEEVLIVSLSNEYNVCADWLISTLHPRVNNIGPSIGMN